MKHIYILSSILFNLLILLCIGFCEEGKTWLDYCLTVVVILSLNLLGFLCYSIISQQKDKENNKE